MYISVGTVPVAGVSAARGASAHHGLVIAAALCNKRSASTHSISVYCSLAYRGSEAAAEEPGALARAAHQLALVVSLAALHLAGVPVAGGGGAGLAEPLHQVPGPGVDGGALQQLAPRAAVALARAVVELGHAAALHQGELSTLIYICTALCYNERTMSALPGQSLLKPPPQAPTAIWSPSHLLAMLPSSPARHSQSSRGISIPARTAPATHTLARAQLC